MNKVTIIEGIKMYPSLVGESKAKWLKIALIVFIVVSVLGLFYDDENRLLYFLSSIFFGGGGYYFFKGRDYKPEKSFRMYRLSNEQIKKLNMYVYGGFILFSVVVILAGGWLYAIFLPPLIISLYHLLKSIKFHEDVDYVVNMEISELLGMEVDEKIQASYQNFDSYEKLESDSNMMLVTDKKVIIAYNKGGNWEIVNKKISDIVKIGYMGWGNNKKSDRRYLRLCFSDDTVIGFHMVALEKFTSNPDLFFRKFLTVLDAVLLGKTDERIASRRRVSVNEDAQPSARTNDENVEIRKVDISSTILRDLKDAIPVESGRSLEL